MQSTDDMEIRIRVYGKDKHKLNEVLKIKQDIETGEVLIGIHDNYSSDFFMELARISVLDYRTIGFQYFDFEDNELKTVELA